MAADPRGPGDPLEQLRADRERHRAEERADAPSSSSVPPPDWRHDTLELDFDGLRHEPAGPPPVVDGSVLSSRTHGGAWRAVRRSAGRARGVRVPAGLVVGLVLLAGVAGASAVLGAGGGPQSSPLQTTTQTGTETTAGGDQPQGSVRVETGGSGAGSSDGSEGGPAPVQGPGQDGGQQPAQPPAPPASGGDAAGAPAGPGAGPGGGPAGGPAGGGGVPGRP
ncbi:MAG: hypothetical protein PGN11_02735 [Quadrisphaera sp.]